MSHPICVGITGASGAVYAVRLLEVLTANGLDVHLSISPSGREVIEQELGLKIALDRFEVSDLLSNPTNVSGKRGRLRYYPCQDFLAPMASGSFLTEWNGDMSLLWNNAQCDRRRRIGKPDPTSC